MKKETEALTFFRKFLEKEPDKDSVLARDALKRILTIAAE